MSLLVQSWKTYHALRMLSQQKSSILIEINRSYLDFKSKTSSKYENPESLSTISFWWLSRKSTGFTNFGEICCTESLSTLHTRCNPQSSFSIHLPPITSWSIPFVLANILSIHNNQARYEGSISHILVCDEVGNFGVRSFESNPKVRSFIFILG